MLVVAAMGDGEADFVQARGPVEALERIGGIEIERAGELAHQVGAQLADMPGLHRIDMVAPHELAHGGFAHVMALEAA